MDELIASIIRSFLLGDYQPIIKRDLSLEDIRPPKRGNLVSVITGVRRCGKTYRLFQTIDELLRAGVSPEQILYFNFEDDRLRPFVADLGSRVVETFFTMSPASRRNGAYLFLDEIQVVPDWDIWLRRVVDTEKVTVFATGSSAKLLSQDIASAFRGRALTYEMTPYSFAEFVRLHATPVPSDGIFTPAQRSELAHLMYGYLERGGFPDVQTLTPKRATMLLQDYSNRVVAADIIERHNLGNPKVASLFAQRVLANNARELSLRKTADTLGSLGIKTSRAFLADLLDYFEDAHLSYTVRPLTRALADSPRSAVKVYAVDPGLAKAVSPATTQDVAQCLEGAVYLELRRRLAGKRLGSISSLKTQQGYEVDFVVGDAATQQGFALYQVSASFENRQTFNREIRALRMAMEEQDLDRATLITLSDERNLSVELPHGKAGQIEIVPAWKWCLEQRG
jgi:predicted AAA+ superfamily ATPase